MNKSTALKLHSYLLTAGAFLLSTNSSEGQIFYHDADPDLILSTESAGASSISLDLNDDCAMGGNCTDIAFKFAWNTYFTYTTFWGGGNGQTSQYGGIQALFNKYNSSNVRVAVSGLANPRVQALDQGQVIKNQDLDWDFGTDFASNSATEGRYLFFCNDPSSSSSQTCDGPWQGVNNKYIAFQIKDTSGLFLSGWIRLSVLTNSPTSNTVVVKDWAWQATPGIPIFAGDRGFLQEEVIEVMTSDQTDVGNASDIHVSFDPALAEIYLERYEILAVRTTDIENYTLADAETQSQLSNRTTTITPTGTQINQQLASTLRDNQGKLIKNGVSYNFFVLSVADTSAASQNVLSKPSNTLELKAPTMVSNNLMLSRSAFQNNASDIRMQFEKAFDESKVAEYRVLLIQSSAAHNMTVGVATDISNNYPDRFVSITPSGSNIDFQLPATLKDRHGDSISPGMTYTAFVLSIKDGVNATSNDISGQSNDFLFNDLSTIANNIVVTDTADNGNSNDLFIRFDKAANENFLSSYKVLVVKSNNAANFSVVDAIDMNAINNSSFPILPTGNNIAVNLPAGLTDNKGNTIKNGKSYNLFVLSEIGDTSNTSYALSNPSNLVTIKAPSMRASNIQVTDIGDQDNASDIRMSFDKAMDESNIIEYKVIIWAGANFNIAQAQSVANNYPERTLSIIPTGSSISIDLPEGLPDRYGNPVEKGTPYRALVLSWADSNSSHEAAVSGFFELTDQITVPQVVLSDNSDNGNASDFQIQFQPATDESNILSYKLFLIDYRDMNSGQYSINDAIANMNNPAKAFTVTPAGSSPIMVNFPVNMVDNRGIPIVNNPSNFDGHQVVILSVVDTNELNGPALSEASNEVKLRALSMLPKNVTIADIGNQNNASDIKLTFDPADDESKVAAYHILLVHYSHPLKINSANAIINSNPDRFFTIYPNGNSIDVQLPAWLKNTQGNAVTNNEFAKVNVLIQADGVNATSNEFSRASNDIILHTYKTPVNPNTSFVKGPVKGPLSLKTADQSQGILLPKFEVYPNPSKGFVNITLNEEVKNSELTIYNTLGKIVKQLSEPTLNTTLNLETSGVYFIKYRINDIEMVKKIIIED